MPGVHAWVQTWLKSDSANARLVMIVTFNSLPYDLYDSCCECNKYTIKHIPHRARDAQYLVLARTMSRDATIAHCVAGIQPTCMATRQKTMSAWDTDLGSLVVGACVASDGPRWQSLSHGLAKVHLDQTLTSLKHGLQCAAVRKHYRYGARHSQHAAKKHLQLSTTKAMLVYLSASACAFSASVCMHALVWLHGPAAPLLEILAT